MFRRRGNEALRESAGERGEQVLCGKVKAPVSMTMGKFRSTYIEPRYKGQTKEGPEFEGLTRADIYREDGGRENESVVSLSKAIYKDLRTEISKNLSHYLQQVREYQIYQNPEVPKNRFMKRLLADITLQLNESVPGFADGEMGEFDLRYYSAHETVLDYGAGVDFWLELVMTDEDEYEEILGQYFVDVTLKRPHDKPRIIEDYRKRLVKKLSGEQKLTDHIFQFQSAHIKEPEITNEDRVSFEKRLANNVEEEIFRTAAYRQLVQDATLRFKILLEDKGLGVEYKAAE